MLNTLRGDFHPFTQNQSILLCGQQIVDFQHTPNILGVHQHM
jgi:hypothetical protein